MNLIVTDETYQYFEYHYPNVSKEELQSILINSKPFTEYDYWNRFEASELPNSYNDNFHLKDTRRENHSFYVHRDDRRLHSLPEVIELKPDIDGIIYWTHE